MSSTVDEQREASPVGVESMRSAALGLVLACAACAPPLEEFRAMDDAGSPDAGTRDAPVPSIDAPPPSIDAPAPLPDAALETGMIELAGDISPVHDPAIIAAGTKFYLFSTGNGLPVRESSDLVHWRLVGAVFATKPSWVTTTNPGEPNALWAPDISYFGDRYHLYYSASSFGSNSSCIGHATTASLDAPSWEDHGAVICSTSSDRWNAIDPAAIVDQQGNAWLSFGSFWDGLQLIRLDAEGARLGTDQIELATRDNTAVEAPYLVHRDGYYYLFESVDRCCQGAASTYKIMVGRSADIVGPYVDHTGNELTAGGGTMVLAGGPRWKGPGHNAVLRTATRDYNVYHSYDAQSGGAPTLRIAELRWAPDGWPSSAGP
jgi:arabinan endo-1,5-alpha-L-arabinosidase